MRSHAEKNDVLKIRMPLKSCGSVKLDWGLVGKLTREVFEGSHVRIQNYLTPPRRHTLGNH